MANGDDPKLDETLKLILAELAKGNAAREEADKAAEKQRSEQGAKNDKADKNASNQLRKADSSLTSLPVIGKMTKLISGTIQATANKSLKLQEAALARGSTLSQAMDQNSKVTNQLGGFMGKQVGSMQAVQTNFEMFAGGLGDASYETSRLVHATRLSSGQQKQLIAGLAKNTRGMGFTSEETSRLADTTLGMAQKYGVSTNELVNAVGGLSDQLYDFAALGIGAGIQEAATVLAAGLGPAMSKVGPELIGAFTKGDSMIQASILGVSAERAELLKQGGDHTKAAIGLVTTGGANAEKLIKQWTSGGMDRGLALQQLTQIYGKETTQLLAARNELKAQAAARNMNLSQYTKAMQKEAKIKQEWQNTWQNFKDKVVSPLQEVVMNFVSIGMGLMSSIGWLIKPLAQLSLGVLSLMMAVIAMKKAFILWQVVQKGRAAAGAAIGAAGGGAKGVAGALGGGLGKLKEFITGGGGKKKGPAGGAPKPGGKGGGLPGAPAGGGGLGGFLGGLGEGLKKLGSKDAMKGAATIAILAASLAIAAVGFGLFGNVDWPSIGKGTLALGVLGAAAYGLSKIDKDIMKGSAAIAVMGVALIPFTYALSMLTGVGIGNIIAAGLALVIFGASAFALGAMLSGPGALIFGVGLLGIIALGVALIPLAYAAAIAAPAMGQLVEALIMFKDVPMMKLFQMTGVMFALGLALLFFPITSLFLAAIAMTIFIDPFMKLIAALTWINEVPIGKMFLLAPALLAITYGLLAMTAGGLMMAAFDGLLKLFGADSPIDKVVKMGKAAEHINKMAKTLKTLPKLLRQTVREMARIKLGPFYLLAHGLKIVKKAIDKFSLIDMMKFKMFAVQPKAQATPEQKIQRRGNEQHQQSYSQWPVQQRKKKQSSWSFQSEGIADVFMPKAGEAPAQVDQARINRKKGEIQELSGRAANMREGGSGQRMVEETLQTLREQLSYLKHIYEKQQEGNEINNEGNEIRMEGNSDRREGARNQRGRPSDRIAGGGVVGSLD